MWPWVTSTNTRSCGTRIPQYSGSVERIDFGEEDEQKGFLLVHLEKGRAEFEFVPLEARPFLTIDVEAKGEDPTAEVLEAIESYDIRDKVVRLIVRTSVEKEPLLKDSEIFRSLEGAFHVAAINKDVERRVRLRLGSRNYEEMTPREILETYLKVKQVPSERTQVLLRYADELFQDLD
jgi:exonuclease SbcD